MASGGSGEQEAEAHVLTKLCTIGENMGAFSGIYAIKCVTLRSHFCISIAIQRVGPLAL